MCDEQFTPIRQIAAATVGCVSFGADCCNAASTAERLLVANLPQRHRRIVLQRALELGDLDQPRHRRGDLVVAERLDHRAAEEIDAAHHVAQQHVARPSDRRRPRPARGSAPAGRTRRLPCRARREASEPARGFGLHLEIAVGHFAQAIVRRRHRREHLVGRARIVEAGQQHEALKRTKPSVCSLTACSSAGDRRRGGARRIVRARCHARRRSRDRRACRSRRGSVREMSAPARAPAQTQDDSMTNNEITNERNSDASAHPSRRFRFFFGQRLALAVDLQGELQVSAFVPRERHGVLPCIARRAVELLLAFTDDSSPPRLR